MTISKSQSSLRTVTLRLMALCKPKMSASYYAVLFVHSNSKQLEIICFLCHGSTKTKRALDLSCVLESSKYNVQKSYVQGICSTLVLLLLLLLTIHMSFSLVGLGRSSNCVSWWWPQWHWTLCQWFHFLFHSLIKF